MEEIWKSIDGYEGLYEVSNFGRVKSLERRVKKRNFTMLVRERILHHRFVGDGYAGVSLSKNGKVKTFSIHSLVAKSFIGKIEKGYDVDHIDRCKTNNNVANLEIVTHQENQRRMANALCDSGRTMGLYTNNPPQRIYEILENGTLRFAGRSISNFCKEHNLNKSMYKSRLLVKDIISVNGKIYTNKINITIPIMKTSEKMLEMIGRFEGLRLEAYRCPANVLTIGYGHTGSDVKEGMTITKEQAFELLRKDVYFAESFVSKVVTSVITQDQFDALVGLTFNIGVGNFNRSTLLKKVNANPNDPTIRDSFAAWNKAGGRVLAGLTKRRKAEADWYFGIKK